MIENDSDRATSPWVHPENRPEPPPLDPPLILGPKKIPVSRRHLILGGMFCAFLGAVLGGVVVLMPLLSGDIPALLSALPLALATIAVVAALASAMIFVESGE